MTATRSDVAAGGGAGLELEPPVRARLAERLERARELARRRGTPVLVSVTQPVDPAMDVSAAVLASRSAGDRCFCFEHPDRESFALAALGEAAAVGARPAEQARAGDPRGRARFASASHEWRTLVEGGLVDDPALDPIAPPATGPLLVGGFAFAPDGGATPEWASFGAGRLSLPEVSLSRHGAEARMTVNVMVDGGTGGLSGHPRLGHDDPGPALLDRAQPASPGRDGVEGLVDAVERRVRSLRPARMPLLDPDPAVPARVGSAAPPEHFASAITRAVERIDAGEIQKVVLAREVRVHAPGPIDAAAVYDGLRTAFPACFCYLAGSPDAHFVGASPELLVRRDGQRAQTVALAGTRRRSADPAVDRHLAEQLLQSAKDRAEQGIVAQRIERALRPASVWVAAADEPAVVKVQNVQHLATPIRAQLAEPVPCLELVGMLHPTPAVGGEPADRALPLIPALEGLDRGWYAGPLGWTDLAEDGEFCVALRCALISGGVAHLYAGEGIVHDSVPSEELEANEAKLQALLPLLT
ncbi:MAG: isochorismate synthase [Actinobacteria bacterium]|nr:isochorismate synthase [Actinomycetota bacterium]